jgi:hypothetical protein
VKTLGLILLLVSGSVFGATTTVTWQNATTRTDGSPLLLRRGSASAVTASAAYPRTSPSRRPTPPAR